MENRDCSTSIPGPEFSNSVHGFFAREKPNPIDWSNFPINPEKEWPDEIEGVVLKTMDFFYAEQKVTLGDVRKIFTNKAIKTLEIDGYMKFDYCHGDCEL